jgi:TonB family protein
MVSAWMLYSMLVGVLAAGAAWALETLLRNHRMPTRWVWTGGIGMAAVWPVWAAFRPDPVRISTAPEGPIPVVTLEPLTLQVGSTSFWQLLDTPLVIVWVLATSGLLAMALHLLLRTRRLRKRWADEKAGGRSVLISEDWGPGVVGFLDPQIVLPRWCQAIEEGGLDLILDHEAEHLKAGDLRLLITAGLAPVVLPWSLPLWWMWHRLRLAVEGDCDLRVLRKNPRATRAYLELLLEVGKRLPEGRMAAAMLSEPERSLERRIRIMTMPLPKKPLLRGAILAGVGTILVAVACWAPTPMALDDDAELPAVVAVPVEAPMSDVARSFSDEPIFTPFTVRPDIKNRNDIAQAMEEAYPPLLRDAGIGGTVNVWFFIDETGVTRRTFIDDGGSSGHPALDDAALSVADMIEFTSAMNRDKAVPVWISLPITFSTR